MTIQGDPGGARRPGAGSGSEERVARNAAAILVGRGLVGASQVAGALVMARELGTAGWGALGLLLSTMEILRVLVSFGLDTVAVRALAIGQDDPRAILRRLVALKIVLWTLVIAAVSGLSLTVDALAVDRPLLLLLGFGLLPAAINLSLTTRFQAEHRMDRLVPVNLLTGASYLLAVVSASRFCAAPAVYVALLVGNDLLAVACTWLVGRWTWGGRAIAPVSDRAALLRLLLQGIPIGLVGLMVVLYSRLGILLLRNLSGVDSVGLYYTAVRVCEPVLMVAGAVAATVYPVLSRRVECGAVNDLKRRFVAYSLRSAVLSIGAGALITVFAGYVLEAIRPEYLPARSALIALAWASAFMFQNQLSTMVVNAFGKFHFVTAFAALNLCVFLSLSFLLIPRLGPLGAGLSTLGTEGLNCAVQLTVVAVLLGRAARAGASTEPAG